MLNSCTIASQKAKTFGCCLAMPSTAATHRAHMALVGYPRLCVCPGRARVQAAVACVASDLQCYYVVPLNLALFWLDRQFTRQFGTGLMGHMYETYKLRARQLARVLSFQVVACAHQKASLPAAGMQENGVQGPPLPQAPQFLAYLFTLSEPGG